MTCRRCQKAAQELDRLVVYYDDAAPTSPMVPRESLRADLCRRCTRDLERWLTPKPATAGERLKATAPDGPPYLGLLLDRPTVEVLAAGGCNARAEVAARKCLDELEQATLGARPAARARA